MRVVQAQAEAARLKLMSQALQRQLPRPNHKKLQVDSEVREGMSEVEKAAAMVEVRPHLFSLLTERVRPGILWPEIESCCQVG